MLKIRKIMISKGEIAESMEYLRNDKLKYYIYSYKILKGKRWITLIRWDNMDGIEHVDIYDENGNYIHTREFARRDFDSIVKIISTFRKNIIAMDLKNI